MIKLKTQIDIFNEDLGDFECFDVVLGGDVIVEDYGIGSLEFLGGKGYDKDEHFELDKKPILIVNDKEFSAGEITKISMYIEDNIKSIEKMFVDEYIELLQEARAKRYGGC